MADSVYEYKYRVDLDYDLFQILKKYINISPDEILEQDLIIFNEMRQKINNPKKIKHSSKKFWAAIEATDARTKKAKQKIQNAINLLRMQDKKITHYAIAKEAGVAYLTVKKYITL